MGQRVARKVISSKLGGRIDFQESKHAMGARESWVGLPRSALREKVLVMRKEYDQARRVFETFNKTKSFAASASAGGVSRKTATNWLSGKKMPKHLSISRATHYIGKRKPLVIRPEKRADFAYILGAMMGNASRVFLSSEKKQGRISLNVKDGAFAEEFKKRLSVSTDLDVRVSQVEAGPHRWYNVNFGSRNLVQLFNELSNYGKHIPKKFSSRRSLMRESLAKSESPTSFLGSREERLEFVRALYDSRGDVRLSGPSNTKTVVIKIPNEEVRLFVKESLTENGFHPVLRKNGVVALSSSETESFVRLVRFRKKTSA